MLFDLLLPFITKYCMKNNHAISGKTMNRLTFAKHSECQFLTFLRQIFLLAIQRRQQR